MRVVLVHPAGSNWIPGKPDVTVVANRMAPLGILSIAAYLKEKGHEVFVLDCLGPYAPIGPEANAKAVLGLMPDLIGFSTTTSGFLDAYAIAEIVKRLSPSTITAFGGVHVSALGAELMERFEAIDFLCVGEGEVTMAELASGESPAKIDGLVWRDSGSTVTNRLRAHLPDLDALPLPAYDMLDGFPKKYHLPPFSFVRSPGSSMITSRGCLYRCSYCDRSVFRHGFRHNSGQYVYDHMKLLREKYGVRHINIYDDLFTTDRERVVELCGMLSSRPLGVDFNCAVRLGYADDDLLGMLKSAGCLMVSLGIETGDPDLLERHKGKSDLDEIRDTVARIQSKGLRVKGLFMMGLPGDTEESIRRTSDFAMSLDLDDMNMSKFTPFPGAPVWKTIREEGELIDDWRLMNCLNFTFVPKGVGSKDRLDQLYNEHVKRFYTSPAWRRRFRRRIWQHRRTLWRMLANLPAFLAAKKEFEPRVRRI